jgi:hypothetical protein
LSKERNVKRSGFSPPRTTFATPSVSRAGLRDTFEKRQASNNPLAWHDPNLAQNDVPAGLAP